MTVFDSELEISRVLFPVYMQSGATGEYFLRWPQDRYYGLILGQVSLQYLLLNEVLQSAYENEDFFPCPDRLSWQRNRLSGAASRGESTWPEMPVLERQAGSYRFIDGRHRSLALANLGAERAPALVVSLHSSVCSEPLQSSRKSSQLDDESTQGEGSSL